MSYRSVQELTELADAAFRQVAIKVAERAEKTGRPLICEENEAAAEPESERARSKSSTAKAAVVASE